VWWAAAQVWAAPVAAAVVVAVDLGMTGMLHLDGLVDSADGLLPPLARERRLDVMADPGAGAFGVGGAVAVLLLRWAALASLRPSVALLACVWCGSRYLMAVATTRMRYARPEGLAGAFLDARSRSLPLLGLLVGAGLAAFGHLPAAAALVVLAVSGSAVLGLADRRIGGFTGDVLGAAGMVGETLGLLAAAVHR
jgi:adenosylcobinamide-GDP ribazoletransferase